MVKVQVTPRAKATTRTEPFLSSQLIRFPDPDGDIMTTPVYVVWSTMRVWCGYFGMRFVSYVAKSRGWERHFAPIDPGMLGLGALVYGGPILSLIGNTSLMAMFHASWRLFLPSAVEFQGAEGATGELGLLGWTLRAP
ncbi:hypothetical protein AC1031_021036 [Aphanomyces cochlioides]|nr:hypothetical protein AC1031_021036 [Aphanomyces cochlioides]